MGEASADVRTLSEQECLDVLARASIARLGCYSPSNDESYVVPTSIQYHPGAVYFASIPGQKLRFLTEHPRGICVEVEETEPNGGRFTVVVTGDFEQVQAELPKGERPKRGPMRSIFEDSPVPYPRESLVLCKVTVRKVSGRHDRWSWPLDFPLPLPAGKE